MNVDELKSVVNAIVAQYKGGACGMEGPGRQRCRHAAGAFLRRCKLNGLARAGEHERAMETAA